MKKSKSILWAWTLSYICLLFIPILSVFANYYSSEKKLKEEYMHTYELLLTNLSSGIDSTLDDIQQFYYYILNNDSFGYMKLSNNPDKNFYYHAYCFQDALSLYHTTNPTLNCTVYHSHLNFISSIQNGCNDSQYHAYLQEFSSAIPEYEEWNTFISAQYQSNYFINNNLSTTNGPALIFANTLDRSTIAPINVFITIPLTEITSLTNHVPDNTFLVIQTADDNLYCFDNSGLFPSENIISTDSDCKLILSEGAASIIADSTESDITYHLIITREAMATNLYNVKKNFFLNLFVTLLLSLVGIFILLRLNYRPISDLLFKLSTTPVAGNELAYIASTYEQLQKDYHSSRLTIQHQKKELFSRRLLSLLKGRISELDFLQHAHDYDIDFYSTFTLIGFWLPIPSQRDIEYDELTFFIVNNIFDELFHEHTFFHMEDGRYIFYLFDLKHTHFGNTDSSHASWNNYALEKVNYLCNLVNDKFNFSIVGSVSDPVDNISNCKFLYRTVLESFEYHNLSSGFFSIDTTKSTEQVRERIEYELNDAITNGDLNTALNASNSIFSTDSDMPFSTQKSYVFDSFTLVMDIFNNYASNPIHKVDAMNYVSLLIQANNVDELQNAFNRFLTFVCETISQKWLFENKDIVLTICKYVEENYTNQLLSVGLIADAINRNPKYISRVFKEDTGEGILEYINKYRIAKAKELMQTHQYTLTEIAEMVGYANIQSFRRAFIKLTGENPSKFSI